MELAQAPGEVVGVSLTTQAFILVVMAAAHKHSKEQALCQSH